MLPIIEDLLCSKFSYLVRFVGNALGVDMVGRWHGMRHGELLSCSMSTHGLWQVNRGSVCCKQRHLKVNLPSKHAPSLNWPPE